MIIPPADRLGQVEEYYFSIKLREIRQRIQEGQDIINLGIGSPDLAPPASTIDTLIEAAKEPQNHAYQPYKGIPELRAAFMDWYNRIFSVALDPDSDILPLMGSKEGIMHISMAFLNPGDEVLIPNPGYPTYASVARLLGAGIRYYELKEENGWQPNLEALAQSSLERVKIMWVNYPHMPTGTSATPEMFDKLIAFAHKHQILLCNDNPYSLVLNPHPISLLSRPGGADVALELNSLSKSHNMAGWRMGMVAGGPHYIQQVLTVKSNMDSGMFLPLQLAAVNALGHTDDWHDERNSVYASRREIAWEILDRLGCSFREDQVGMFLWAKLPVSWQRSADFSEHILDNSHVFLTPGFIFGEQGEGYVRLSLCTDQDRLAQALERVKSLEPQKLYK